MGRAQESAVTGLTAAAEVRRAYDAVFDARFDEVPGLLERTCPPAPDEACRLVETLALWWQIQLDPNDTSRDAVFAARIDEAIAATEAWTEREPRRAEAWFYSGVAYGGRVQFRSLRGQRLGAARDGARAKSALEVALELDPAIEDAWFGLGLYHYYAAVAPAAARLLRLLLFLPGGNREQGLAEMQRARERGLLIRSEADYQLHLIYIWYERQAPAALELLAGLRARHPGNPHFIEQAARIEEVYLSDYTRSLSTWESLIAAARAGRVRNAAAAEIAARLGAARQLRRLGRSEEAMAQLRQVIARQPDSPYSALAEAHVMLGEILVSLGRNEEAAEELRLAIATTPPRDPLRVRSRANDALRSLR